MKMWCLSAYPKGIQDVGDFVSSVEHKQRFLTQTFAVCQSYNASQWDLIKTRNDRSVQETEQDSYSVLPLVRPSWARSQPPWHVFFLLCSGSQTYKCITATYLSNGPLPLLIKIVSMVHLRDRWRYCTYKSGIRHKARRKTVGPCGGSEVKTI